MVAGQWENIRLDKIWDSIFGKQFWDEVIQSSYSNILLKGGLNIDMYKDIIYQNKYILQQLICHSTQLLYKYERNKIIASMSLSFTKFVKNLGTI